MTFTRRTKGSDPNGTTLSENVLHDVLSLRLQLRFEHGTRLR